MSTAIQESSESSSSATSASFVRSRLGSLLAVMPLGVWTAVHLWSNLSAFQGADAWEKAVTHHSHPIASFLTSLIALAPLAIHTVWGISRMVGARVNVQRYGFFANFKYILQRASAIGVVLFLGAHIFKAKIEPNVINGHPEPFSDMATNMAHHGPTLAVYVLGTLGVAYHLSNGISTFAMGWGLVSSRRALRKVELASYGLFAVLLSMSWGTIYALYRAGS
jgi:succinate dehydrogenase / fumarate reductase, cytochrome b subunit